MTKMIAKAAARREAFRQIEADMLDLKSNRLRRFRNALLALILSDPRWMVWVERNLPPRLVEIADADLQMLESAMRARVLSVYSFTMGEPTSGMIFRPGWAFTDRGSLSPG